ncbi:MAG: hypothetical protein AB7S86_04245 [Hydrogenophaga sp.]|uniref:hypothetical protein n=1 Tax=Hydrogenophaga sp. TaxID=1904254 RepID=UPI003D0BBDF2
MELCIGLEEALMSGVKRTVGSVMVKSPITVEPWQPVAHARQLMLMHSFSYLPLWLTDQWWLLSELGLAKFLNASQNKKHIRLGLTIEQAIHHQPKLQLLPVPNIKLLTHERPTEELLQLAADGEGPTLWLVIEDGRINHLAGVLSPFELM